MTHIVLEYCQHILVQVDYCILYTNILLYGQGESQWGSTATCVLIILYVLIILLYVSSMNILVRKPVAGSHTTIYVSSYYHIYVSSYNIYIRITR